VGGGGGIVFVGGGGGGGIVFVGRGRGGSVGCTVNVLVGITGGLYVFVMVTVGVVETVTVGVEPGIYISSPGLSNVRSIMQLAFCKSSTVILKIKANLTNESVGLTV